jgi:photosystem II stability/assembly factor-like uncharacterized protein
MTRTAAAAVALLACVIPVGACSASTSAQHASAAHASPSPRRLTSEPSTGVEVGRHTLMEFPAGSGDGSMMMGYEVRGGCYLRRIYPDGTVAGWFSHAGYCPAATGTSRGFIGLDDQDLLHQSVDISQPPKEIKIAADDPGRSAHPGDSLLGNCAEIGNVDAGSVSGEDAHLACAYSPKDHTLYRVPFNTLAIDAAARVWGLKNFNTITVSDGKETWQAAPFRAYADQLLTSATDSAAVFLEDRDVSMYVTSDAGRSWNQVTGVPSEARNGNGAAMLPDGRLFLGPTNGRFWRGADATNRAFETIGAGPITTVVPAGKMLYGLADMSQDRALQRTVWMSADAGSTWRKVLDAGGAVATTSAVPAGDLQPQLAGPDLAAQIDRLAPAGVSLNANGLMLVTYGLHDKSAWRLFGPNNKVVAQGLDGSGSHPVRAGFLLSSGGGLKYLDATGTLAPVNWHQEERRYPVAAGDVFVPGFGVYRPRTREVFEGAGPDGGHVTTVDGQGRMWALDRTVHGHTIVRWGIPGRMWSSRDLGPGIGASQVLWTGSSLIVPGRQQLYVSLDVGRTWRRLNHGAVSYWGPAMLVVDPDGAIYVGDTMGTIRVSHDHGQTFEDWQAIVGDARPTPPLLGDNLFVRGNRHHPEISRDATHWSTFTPAHARTLLNETQD